MPFTLPFNEHIGPNDILYGLNGPQFDRLQSLINSSAVTDRQADAMAINGYKSTNFERNTMWNLPDLPYQRDYARFLMRHQRYGVIVNNDTYSYEDQRKKSKAGLAWVTDGTGRRPATIHFFLDQLDLYKVIHKQSVTVPISGRLETINNSITGSELRWIYRNRFRQNVAARIQFWYRGAAVQAPWLTYPTQWESYNPKSLAPSRPTPQRGVFARFFCLA
jgi:hypothetical protein